MFFFFIIFRFESPSKVFGGPIYGVVDSFVEKQLIDYQDILDEASFKEIKALKMNKTCFYGLNKVKYYKFFCSLIIF